MEKKVAVVAIGGNSLDQRQAAPVGRGPVRGCERNTFHIADMIEAGWDVAIGHGNGPQVGFILAAPKLPIR
jgi:carbamate kinase